MVVNATTQPAHSCFSRLQPTSATRDSIVLYYSSITTCLDFIPTAWALISIPRIDQHVEQGGNHKEKSQQNCNQHASTRNPLWSALIPTVGVGADDAPFNHYTTGLVCLDAYRSGGSVYAKFRIFWDVGRRFSS